jgi:hypothetical protein
MNAINVVFCRVVLFQSIDQFMKEVTVVLRSIDECGDSGTGKDIQD